MKDATQRLKKAINWLIFQEIAVNETALAELLGYTKSSFSQIVNGKVPLSDRFVKALCSLDDSINEVWVKTGEGHLFKKDINISQTVDNNSGVITNNIGSNGNSTSNTTNTTANNYADCDKGNVNVLLGKALNEIAEQRKLVAKAQGQMDRLMTLLEKQ